MHQYGKITVRADGLDGPKAFQYEATVIGMLRALDTTQTGHAVLNGIRFYQREVLIYPYDPHVMKHERVNFFRVCNAAAYSDWGMFRTKVSFTPNLWFQSSGCMSATWGGRGPLKNTRITDGNAGVAPDEILVHELTHAVRSVAGKLGSLSTWEEEKIAALVTNIYSSETHRKLRDYPTGDEARPFKAIDDRYPDSKSEGYLALAKNRRVIDALYKQQRDFCRFLARVQAPWNPLRVYFAQQRLPGLQLR